MGVCSLYYLLVTMCGVVRGISVFSYGTKMYVRAPVLPCHSHYRTRDTYRRAQMLIYVYLPACPRFCVFTCIRAHCCHIQTQTFLYELKGHHSDGISSLVAIESDDKVMEIWSGSWDKTICYYTYVDPPSAIVASNVSG